MAKTIGQLTQATTLAGGDKFAIEQSGVTKHVDASVVRNGLIDANIDAAAAIAFSKLAALDSANILVGNGSNVATKVAVTGDVTISNAGVTAIGSSKVVTAMINNAAVTAAKLAPKVTFPNYAAGVGKAYNTVHQAAEDGFLCVTVSGSFMNGIRVLVGTTNDPALEIWLNGDDINSNTKIAGSGMLPIPKDIYYKVAPHPSFDGFESIVINWYPVIS
jgi:hypothetical protein